VGLFVFIGMALIGSCTVILGGRNLFEEPILMETYFDESVQGLEVGSPIKLRGVKIGSVSEIQFVAEEYPIENLEDLMQYGQMVLVTVEVFPADTATGKISFQERKARIERMIERGMRLRLTTAGLTGTSFIQADYLDPERHPPMKIAWEPRNLYVPSAPSTMATISTAAERIAERLEKVEVDKVVADLDTLIVTVTDAVRDLDVASLRQGGSQMIEDLRRTSRAVRQVLQRAESEGVGAKAEEALDQMTATLVRVQSMIESGRYDFELALENLRVTSENMRELTDTLRSQPSLLLRSSPPQPSQKVSSP
jgi:phospholipid/cholesterol/gamma-HCH transport system substrate-binding protein/paraquat-inducible protein B